MASAGDDEADSVLSDVEAEDDESSTSTIGISDASSSSSELTPERFRDLVSQLEREKQARLAAEKEKSDINVTFQRLKGLAHEAIKKRDESNKLRDEAVREKERLERELAAAREEKEREVEEAVKGKEAARGEIEAAAQMLVTGIEKISGKASHVKNFGAAGLPRSQKYTGLSAVAYGVIKRTNEIVEELLRQIDVRVKERDEAREQMEQRNYAIAIEVSQLEATIGQLREEVMKKSAACEAFEKAVVERDGKLSEVEIELSEKLRVAANEGLELRRLVEEYDSKVRDLEAKMETQRPLLVEQLGLVSKIHEQLYGVIKIVDVGNSDQSDLSESLFLPQETGLEENVRAFLAGLESIYELSKIVVVRTKDVIEEKNREVKSLNETVARLVREKEHVGVLLRGALSKRLASDASSKTGELFQVAENGLRSAGIDVQLSNHVKDGKLVSSSNKENSHDKKEDEIYTLAGALENIIKESQLEIFELQHAVEKLRAESSFLTEQLEIQAKELSVKKQRIEELEERERSANENVDGLMMDVTAAEEEINRWKVAAEQEAAAGRAVEQEYLSQLSALKQELEEARQAIIESEKKLKLKEETAAAAMAARDAAEKSLRLADIRSTRLRDRVEELTHQLQEDDTKEDSRRSKHSARYMCWPWEWLGLDFVGARRTDAPQLRNSNEMELSEPLL